MLVALPVFQGDVPKLRSILEWIAVLGGCKGHRAVIVADAGTLASDVFALKDEAARSFDEVVVVCTDTALVGWPIGPNSLFLKAAEFAQFADEPWLFLEPDAIPLKKGWLDSLAKEYDGAYHVFVGSLVPCNAPNLPQVHLSGVAMYPPNAYDLLAETVAGSEKAFDISTAHITVPKAQQSKTIQFLWGEMGNPPTFQDKGIPKTNVFDLSYIRPDAVLFHRNKDGTLIDLLRAKMIPKPKRTFIQLGRYGDIILLLPALKHIADTTGQKPRLICAKEYASVLDGVSYVESVPIDVHWWSGMTHARRFAKEKFGEATVLQCYANEWGINLSQWPNFMASMHERTGVPMSLFKALPLVFDRRNASRESASVPKHGKPYIVVNCFGHSSPFPYSKQLKMALLNLSARVQVFDVSNLKLHRIYDLLGIMDRAVGTVTIDTATLHLAHGSKRPYVAFTVDGWCSSTPRGNCTLEVKYSNTLTKLPEVIRAVESWL